MIRFAVQPHKKIANCCQRYRLVVYPHRCSCRLQSTQADDKQSSSKGGGFFKKLKWTAGLATFSASAIVVGAYISPEFRDTLQRTIPGTSSIFDSILGDHTFEKTKQTANDMLERVVAYLPSRKSSDRDDELPKKSIGPKVVAIALPKPLTTSESDGASSVEQIKSIKAEIDNETKAAAAASDPLPSSTVVEQPAPIKIDPLAKKTANEELEERIKNAIISAENKLKIAIASKQNTIVAIEEHARMLRSAVDDIGEPSKWDEVAVALNRMQMAANIDANDEVDARNYFDSLRKVINDGRSSNLVADNPILNNATESLNKLTYLMDELNSNINQAQIESRILTQYKTLIETSRQSFANELKSILPNIDIHAQDAKLSEDELNSLIAHAHLRVDQLRRQLAEQQLREEQHIAHAVDAQKAEDARSAEVRIERELARARDDANLEMERRMLETRRESENELQLQLRRAYAAHSEHLEQVVRAQKELLEMEHARLRDAAVEDERALHHRHIDSALARLEGIEAALEQQAVQDTENRHSKQLWIACQHLVESIVHGRTDGYDYESRRKPLANELGVIKEACGSDPFVASVLQSLPDEALYRGVYTQDDLKTRFDKLYTVASRTCKIDDNGGSLMNYLLSWLESSMHLYRTASSVQTTIDLRSIDALDVLARARSAVVDRDDFASAVRLLQLLSGEPANVARDWLFDARTHLEARMAADLLLAHAAATSLRTIY